MSIRTKRLKRSKQLTERESASRLASLGGSMPALSNVRRRKRARPSRDEEHSRIRKSLVNSQKSPESR
jgi:hypothetical protein